MRVNHLILSLAMLATAAQPAFAAANESCFTREETRMALSYLAPLLIEGVVETCTPHLTQESPLLLQGPGMAANYRAVSNPTDADIEGIFHRLAGVKKDAPPGLTLALVKDEIFNGMAKDIDSDDCASADRLVGDLAALPAANVLGLIETIIITAEQSKRQKKARRIRKPIAASAFCEG